MFDQTENHKLDDTTLQQNHTANQDQMPSAYGLITR
jgi:hypothetical protein